MKLYGNSLSRIFPLSIVLILVMSACADREQGERPVVSMDSLGFSQDTIVAPIPEIVSVEPDQEFFETAGFVLVDFGFFSVPDSFFKQVMQPDEQYLILKMRQKGVDEGAFDPIKRIQCRHYKFGEKITRDSEDFTAEIWEFETSDQAAFALEVLEKNRKNFYTKPPREQWVKDAKLYFITTRAAMWLDVLDEAERSLREITEGVSEE